MKTKEEIIGKYFSTLRGQLMQTPKIFSASDVQILSRNIEGKCLEFIEAYHEEKTRELNNELQNLKNELAEIKPCKHFGLEKRTDDTVEYFCANCGIKL